MKKVFITSATGMQGDSIAKALISKNIDVVSITRNEGFEKDGLRVLKGSLENKEDLVNAMKSCEAVILTLPILFDAELVKNITLNIIEATKENGIKKIIFNTSIPLGERKIGFKAIDVKYDALEVLNNSDLDVITLMPTLYLENIASPFLLPVIREYSILPYPIAEDFSFSWLSYENLGRYCLNALTNEKLIGKKVLITNKEKYTGKDLALLISNKTKKNIPFMSTPIDEFEKNLQPILGDEEAKEIADMYLGVDKNRKDFLNEKNVDLFGNINLQSTKEWMDSISW